MPIYLSAQPGQLLLSAENGVLRFTPVTAQRLRQALLLVAAAPSASSQRQVDHLTLCRADYQISISDGTLVIFISLSGVANLIRELPRYITLASTLALPRRRRPRHIRAHRCSAQTN